MGAPWDEKRQKFLTDAPISRWFHVSSFDKATDCEGSRAQQTVTMDPKAPANLRAMSVDQINGTLYRCVPAEAIYPAKQPAQK